MLTDKPTYLPPPVYKTLSYAAFNGELHADNYVGASSFRLSAHESYDFGITRTSHCEACVVDEILADCSQSCLSAKIKSPPNIPAIWYVSEYKDELMGQRTW